MQMKLWVHLLIGAIVGALLTILFGFSSSLEAYQSYQSVWPTPGFWSGAQTPDPTPNLADKALQIPSPRIAQGGMALQDAAPDMPFEGAVGFVGGAVGAFLAALATSRKTEGGGNSASASSLR